MGQLHGSEIAWRLTVSTDYVIFAPDALFDVAQPWWRRLIFSRRQGAPSDESLFRQLGHARSQRLQSPPPGSIGSGTEQILQTTYKRAPASTNKCL
jgi:hypothetical protein